MWCAPCDWEQHLLAWLFNAHWPCSILPIGINGEAHGTGWSNVRHDRHLAFSYSLAARRACGLRAKSMNKIVCFVAICSTSTQESANEKPGVLRQNSMLYLWRRGFASPIPTTPFSRMLSSFLTWMGEFSLTRPSFPFNDLHRHHEQASKYHSMGTWCRRDDCGPRYIGGSPPFLTYNSAVADLHTQEWPIYTEFIVCTPLFVDVLFVKSTLTVVFGY
jgi:hypothetical protein